MGRTATLKITSRDDLQPGHVKVVTARLGAARQHIEQSVLAWLVIGALVSLISLWQGFGYAVGGAAATQNNGWLVLTRLLPGGIRTHGLIMAMLGFALLLDLRGVYTRRTRFILRLLRTYCLIVAVCWVGSWVEFGISWGAPGWWLLLSALTVWMTYFAPSPPGGGDRA